MRAPAITNSCCSSSHERSIGAASSSVYDSASVFAYECPGGSYEDWRVRFVRVRRHGSTRDLLVSVANGGNVTEQLGTRLTVTLVRSGRLLSRLRLRGSHELFPGSGAVFPLRYAGQARGVVTAVVRVRLGGQLRLIERRYRLRL